MYLAIKVSYRRTHLTLGMERVANTCMSTYWIKWTLASPGRGVALAGRPSSE